MLQQIGIIVRTIINVILTATIDCQQSYVPKDCKAIAKALVLTVRDKAKERYLSFLCRIWLV